MTIEEIIVSSIITYVIIVLVVFLYPKDEPEENHTVLLLTTNEPVIARYDAQIQAFFRMNEHSKYCVYVDLKTYIAWCEVPVFTKGD